MDWSIHTYGDGEALYNQLFAIKMMVENVGAIPKVLTLIALFVGGIFLVVVKGKPPMRTMVLIIIFSGIGNILFLKTGTINVVIEDEQSGYTNAITGVPTGLTIVLGTVSTLEYELTRWIETFYSTPNSLALTKSGLGFSMISELSGSQAFTADDDLLDSFKYYYYNCIRTDLALRNKSQDDIKRSEDLLTTLEPTTSLETIIFDGTDATGKQVSCSEAWSYISGKIPIQAQKYIDEDMRGMVNITNDRLNDGLSAKNTLLYGMSGSASKGLEQQMIRNLLNWGHLESAKIIGGDAITSAYSEAIAKRANRENWTRTGQQALNNLPMIRSVYYSLFVGLFLLLAMMSIASMNAKFIMMGITFLFSLALWNPIGTIMNFHYFYELEQYIDNLAYLGNEMTIYKMDKISEKSADMLSFLTSIFALIPALSMMLISGSAYAVTRFMESGMGSSTGVSSTSEELARGNSSTGNASHDNNTSQNIRNGAKDVFAHGNHYSNATGGVSDTSHISATDGSTFMQTDRGGTTTNSGFSGTSSFNGSDLMSADAKSFNASDSNLMQSSEASLQSEVQSAQKSYMDAVNNSMDHTMGSGTTANRVDTYSSSTGVDRSTSQELVNARETSTAEALNKVLTDEQKAEAIKNGSTSVGASFFGTGGELSYIDKDGTSHSWKMSSDQTQAFKSLQSEKFGELYNESTSLRNAVDNTYSSSSNVGSSETRSTAHSFSETKSNLDQFQTSVGYSETHGNQWNTSVETNSLDYLASQESGYSNGSANTKASIMQGVMNKIETGGYSSNELSTAFQHGVSKYGGGVDDSTSNTIQSGINNTQIGAYEDIDKPIAANTGDLESTMPSGSLNKDVINDVQSGKKALENSKWGTSENELNKVIERVDEHTITPKGGSGDYKSY